MLCTTVRKSSKEIKGSECECAFMTKKGCSYNGGSCRQIIEKCNGCNRVIEYEANWYCTVAPDPSLKWRTGNCNLATHIVEETAGKDSKKINPLKASKRSMTKK